MKHLVSKIGVPTVKALKDADLAKQFNKGVKSVIKETTGEIKNYVSASIKDAAREGLDGFSKGFESGYKQGGALEATAFLKESMSSKASQHSNMAELVKKTLVDSEKHEVVDQAKGSSVFVAAVMAGSRLVVQASPEEYKDKVAEVSGKLVASSYTLVNESGNIAAAAGRAAGTSVGESVSRKVNSMKNELIKRADEVSLTNASLPNKLKNNEQSR